MQINRSERISIVTVLDKLYNRLANNIVESQEYASSLSVAAKLFIKLQPLFKDNSLFNLLYKNVYDFLSFQTEHTDIKILNRKRVEFLKLLEQFEFSLLEGINFDIFLYDYTDTEIPINRKYVQSVTDLSINTITQESISLQENQQNFSVLIYQGEQNLQETIYTDFCFQAEEIVNSLNSIDLRLRNVDYHKYDKLYLEAKLDSLKKRQDIRLLLAGSSYTKCGLIEDQMPLPARNVAVDTQDLYYTLKTVRTALEYNQKISRKRS